MKRPLVRDDLRSMDGYHSPQVEVKVRLNTNEAPLAPPKNFRQRFWRKPPRSIGIVTPIEWRSPLGKNWQTFMRSKQDRYSLPMGLTKFYKPFVSHLEGMDELP